MFECVVAQTSADHRSRVLPKQIPSRGRCDCWYAAEHCQNAHVLRAQPAGRGSQASWCRKRLCVKAAMKWYKAKELNRERQILRPRAQKASKQKWRNLMASASSDADLISGIAAALVRSL